MTREHLLLDRLLADTRALFGDDLVGMYVHGSLAFGCFRWETSDLDVLVVTRSVPSQAQKEVFLVTLLATNGCFPFLITVLRKCLGLVMFFTLQ